VLFKVKHNGASYFYGRFNEVEGTVTYDADDVSKSSVEIKIKADSVDSNSKKRDQHLLSPDFLDAKQFPEMKFTSSSVAMKGDVLQATGILDFHGTRKEITIDIDKVGEGKTRKGGVLVGFHSQFTIDRTDFGVTYGEGALGADIELTVSLETISK
jgi:polyisoprenoid-binding protein YceI